MRAKTAAALPPTLILILVLVLLPSERKEIDLHGTHTQTHIYSYTGGSAAAVLADNTHTHFTVALCNLCTNIELIVVLLAEDYIH